MVIYEAEKGNNSPECGKINFQLSGWYFDSGSLDLALEYANFAYKTFESLDISHSNDLLEATYNCAKFSECLNQEIGKVQFCE